MHRFYVPPSECQKDEFELRPQDARHAFNVLRLSKGDEVEVLNGLGDLIHSRLISCSKRSVSVRVESKTHQSQPTLSLGLALPLLKPKAMDWSLQKATELGVSHIWLMKCERSVVHWKQKDISAKLQKIETLLIESMKQCGAVWKPYLHAPATLNDTLRSFEVDCQCLYGSLYPDTPSIPLWKAAEHIDGRLVCWCIGPEGDFTENEIQSLTTSGAQAVDMGPLILRAETAVTCGLSVLGQRIHFRRQMDA